MSVKLCEIYYMEHDFCENYGIKFGSLVVFSRLYRLTSRIS